MQTTNLRSRMVLLLVGVLLFGGAAWLNGGPIGNAGAWLMVMLVIGWPTAVFGRRCAALLRGRRAFLNADGAQSSAPFSGRTHGSDQHREGDRQ